MGYPTVFRDRMDHATLASSHLNMALRCYDVGMLSPITGRKFDVGGDRWEKLCPIDAFRFSVSALSAHE